MEKNIFENAKFGDMYWTALEPDNEFPEGRPAIFSHLAEDNVTHEVNAILYLYSGFCEIWCTLDGRYFDWVGGEKKFWDDMPNPFIVKKCDSVSMEEHIELEKNFDECKQTVSVLKKENKKLIDKAWEWMRKNIRLIGSPMELHSKFIKAMEE